MNTGACSDSGKVAGVSIESLVCPFCPVGYRVPLGWPSIHDILSEAGLTMRVYDSWTAHGSADGAASGFDVPEHIRQVLQLARTGERAWAHYTMTWVDGHEYQWTAAVDPPYDRIADELRRRGYDLATCEQKDARRVAGLGFALPGEGEEAREIPDVPVAVLGCRLDVPPMDDLRLRRFLLSCAAEVCEGGIPGYFHPGLYQAPGSLVVQPFPASQGMQDDTLQYLPGHDYGSQAPLRLVFQDDWEEIGAMARRLVQAWAGQGIAVEAVPMGRWHARQAVARGAFHLFILAFSIPADPCYLGTSQMYQTDGMYNYTGLSSQVVDDALRLIRRASEGDDLRAAVAQIDSAIREAGAALHLGKLDSGKRAAEPDSATGEPIAIRPITMDDVSYGVCGCVSPWHCVYPYPRAGMSPSYPFWSQMIQAYGTMGLLAFHGDACVGMITFLPKTVAGRIGYATCRTNGNLERTLNVICINVGGTELRKGRASALLHAAEDYARANGYVRIEAFAAEKEADEQALHWQSASLFARHGYKRDPDTCGPWWTPQLFYRELV
ncbi:MAG: GNAT family N-acetyltransferase [Bacillota bacterium]|jgi:GNAT superfamily N-acetyltransferase